MIIKEKINQAAEAYAWVGNQYDLKSAFKAGIEWFSKNIWHKAEEQPIEDTPILKCYMQEGKYHYIVSENDCTKTKLVWDALAKADNLERWAYIKDIF